MDPVRIIYLADYQDGQVEHELEELLQSLSDWHCLGYVTICQ